MGRPRGTGVPAAGLAGRNGNVRVLLHLPEAQLGALRARPELPVTAHLRVALTRFLERPRAGRPRVVELHARELGPGRQVWLPRELLDRVEQEYGIARREAVILAAVGAYLGR